MIRRLAVAVPLALAPVAVAVVATNTGASQPAAHHAEAAPTEEVPIAGVIDALATIDTAERYATAYWQQVAEYATAANLAAWVAAHQPPSVHRAVVRSSGPVSHGGVGACTGFAIPDWIIARESGGNPFVWNTRGSGAFGCAQTLITHYQGGGTCAGDDPNTIDGQRDCVNRLSNGGTNLAPWRG